MEIIVARAAPVDELQEGDDQADNAADAGAGEQGKEEVGGEGPETVRRGVRDGREGSADVEETEEDVK